MWIVVTVENGREPEILGFLKKNFPESGRIKEWLLPVNVDDKEKCIVVVPEYIFCDVEKDTLPLLKEFLKKNKLGEVLGVISDEEIQRVKEWR